MSLSHEQSSMSHTLVVLGPFMTTHLLSAASTESSAVTKIAQADRETTACNIGSDPP